MLRKILTLVLVAVGLLATSVVVAGAATGIDPQASLRQGQDVLPGNGRTFEIEVLNGLAEPINWVSVILPSPAGIATAGLPSAPPGWSAQIPATQQAQTVRFTTSAAPIPRGGSLAFTFPANVAAPADSDRGGVFSVAVSANGGQTTTPATGALTSTIRILEVRSLAATAPAGVTDQTATAGQDITYGVTVTNHAAQAVAVTPKLTSSGSDSIGSAAAAPVASGATRTFELPVTLGTSSGTRTFTGSATAATAESLTNTAALAVQTRALVQFNRDSFQPKFVRSDAAIPYTFEVDVHKTGDPALTITACTLSFAGTEVAASGLPRTLSAGTDTAKMRFGSTTVTGAENSYTAQITCSARDANHKPESPVGSLADVVTIDNTRPAVSVDPLGVPSGQDAVKRGDTIRISGTVYDATSTALSDVGLRTDTGDAFPCDSGSLSRSSARFECTVSDVAFAAGTNEVSGQAQATDAAGNAGGGVSTTVPVDLIKPSLHFAETEKGSGIGDRVRVQFDERPVGRVIRGGCDPSAWTVTGHRVVAVQYSDGSSCRSGQAGPTAAPDNYRILVLAAKLETDETPDVTYTPGSGKLSDNVRDGAGHLAERVTVTAVTGLLPAAPDIMRVTRTDQRSGERESATAEASGDGTMTYWTNRTGVDLVVEFAGAKAGYRVQVVDGDGRPVTAPEALTGTSGEVAVPIGNTDGRVRRGIQFINAKGAGEIASFDVVLDRAAPTIESATASRNALTGETQAPVAFSEVLAFGRDFASDWFLLTDDGYAFQANSVSGSGDRRTLSSKAFSGQFAGVEYYLGEDEGRYEDRAGNLLADGAWGSV